MPFVKSPLLPRRLPQPPRCARVRTAATMGAINAPAAPAKKEGDISDAFVSLSGADRPPLPPRFKTLKESLVAGREDDVADSWRRLLEKLSVENEIIAAAGPKAIPEIRFGDLDSDLDRLKDEIKKRGAAVIRGVVPEKEARAYKDDVEEYVRRNPSTRAFPHHDPQVFELYWSPSQIRARSHPSLLRASKALMQQLWHCSDEKSLLSLSQPMAYADRLRIRQPGDASFALGPHQDGGSVERWEKEGYGVGGPYDPVFAGRWEAYDPWDASTRVDVEANLYDGLGPCSMFRMFQGWLSMSTCGPRQGTLLVKPLAQLATAYTLLRPFFRPVKSEKESRSKERYLSADNWVFTAGGDMTSELQGATPGHGQEFTEDLHPHLELERSMVHMPDVKPGDFVVWHCDTIHSVDKVHNGKSDSSVLYIPVCPVTEVNARYLRRQREAFLNGTPGPDFPGGKGEAEHVGRPTEKYLREHTGSFGLQGMGLEKLSPALTEGEGARTVMEKANQILGFE